MSFRAAAGHHQGDDDDQGGPTGTNTIAIDRLPLDEIDYIALGDFHGPMAAGPKAAYSGTPEIDRFPKEGQEPGHVACVTVARGAVPTVAAVRTGRFRWLTREVNLDATGRDAADAYGPAYLDDVLTHATEPQSPGEPGFDGCLADVRLTGTVSLAGRVELDRVIESWRARLLRLDLADDVRIAPTADEIHDLTARPDDPIIARVATELVRRLEAGEADGDLTTNLAVVRHALHILHELAHTTTNAASTGAANA
jgi:DNA repair exonuclease SbcCD nuclease subunit